MIFSPISGTPIVTQGFGQNPQIYSQFGLSGHNGIDFGVPEGTLVYAPHDGDAWVYNDGANGYGLYLVIESPTRRSMLAHLSEAMVGDGKTVYQGDPVGKSGKTGFATAPHLHWTYKIMKNKEVQNHQNGYEGAVDITEFTRLWLDKDLHYDATFTDEAKPYLQMVFAENVYLKNPSRNA